MIFCTMRFMMKIREQVQGAIGDVSDASKKVAETTGLIGVAMIATALAAIAALFLATIGLVVGLNRGNAHG